jgi:DNA polymerase III delta prime subunit
VERFVRASVEDFEMLFVNADGGRANIAAAAYPPGCDPPTGSLRFRLLDVGGLMVEVERRELDADDFRLGVLFYSGSCVFTDANDLAGFFRGAVAAAFGMTVDQLPNRSADDFMDDLRPRTLETHPRPKASSRRRGNSRAPSDEDLAHRLSVNIRGQDEAVHRIADVVSAQLAKTAPSRPESLMLIGPSGCGKTSAVEALPKALDDLGCPGAHVFRVDCNELTDDYDVRRFVGAAPGLVGFEKEPPFLAALSKPRCIVLLDEFEKAHEAVRSVFLGLLDEGRITSPNGASVEAPDAIIAMTSNLGVDDLAYQLRQVPQHDRWRQQICRDHLIRMGWPNELVGRIGAFAVFEPLGQDAARQIAEGAIQTLGLEYGLQIEALPPVIVDVVLELADASEIGARALNYAARELLAQSFVEAARQGFRGGASIDAGPPPRVVVGDPVLF